MNNLNRTNASVNSTMGDVSDRNSQARQAGEILYNFGRGDSVTVSSTTSAQISHSSRGYGAISYEELPENDRLCCGPMSPVRRTFCLIVTFDLIVSIILYIIYTRILSFDIEDYRDEIIHYSFKTSLFDTVLCAAWRFAPLLLAYALFRLSHPWPVAVTTFFTCAYVIAKVIVFQWSPPKSNPDAVNHNNVICYTLLILSFVISWVETWFLDFQVLPREHKARQRAAMTLPSTEASHLLNRNASHNVNDHDIFSSLPESQEGSEDESHEEFHSTANTRHHSRQPSKGSSTAISLGAEEQEYLQKAEATWERAWQIGHDNSGWSHQKGETMENGKVFTKKFENLGRLFKLESHVNCRPDELFEQLVLQVADAPKWNTTVSEARVIQVINDNTDICYTVAAESAGGLVSSRDFVNLRHWKARDGVWLSSGISVEHPDLPVTRKHIRGHNYPGGWFFKPVPGAPNKTHFVFLMNVQLKGWIPQWTVDQALSSTLLSFLRCVKIRMASRKKGHPKS